MNLSLGEAFIMALAMIVGVAVILVGSVLIAAAFAAWLNPSAARAPTPEEELERAERLRDEDELWARQQDRRDEIRGRESIDSHHVSFRMFGWVCGSTLLLVSLSVILAHADDPGEGFPLQLMLRPVWIAPILGLMAGVAAGSWYQTRFRRLPPWRQRELRAQQKAKRERSHQKRFRDIRDRTLGRLSSKHY